MWTPPAGAPFGDDPLDNPELTDEERESIMDMAHTIIDTLSAQGFTQEEMIDAVEDLMDRLEFEEDLYDKTDEELLELAADLGVAAGRDALENLMRTSVSEPEVADKICEQANLDLED